MLTTAPVHATTFDVQITVGKSKYYSDSMMAFLSFEGFAFVGSVAVVETFGIGGCHNFFHSNFLTLFDWYIRSTPLPETGCTMWHTGLTVDRFFSRTSMCVGRGLPAASY